VDRVRPVFWLAAAVASALVAGAGLAHGRAPTAAETTAHGGKSMVSTRTAAVVVGSGTTSTRRSARPRFLAPFPGPRPAGRAVPAAGASAFGPDPARRAPSGPSPGPTIASFQALPDNNTAIPPDTHGAVGPTHVMTVLNTQVNVQTRSGAAVSGWPMGLDAFWAPLGFADVFDPKVVYDPYGDRFVFVACAEPEDPDSAVLIGVSDDSNPVGTWTLHAIGADALDISWADYPSIGFNKDWIVLQLNMFTNIGSVFDFSRIFVVDKADLYTGGDPLSVTLFDDIEGFTQAPTISYDPTVATVYLVEDWNGDFGGSGFLRLSTISGPVGSEVYTTGIAFPQAPGAPWSFAPPFANFAPQLGSAEKLAANDSRMQTCVYRNGSIWCTHTVFLPSGAATRSAVQWWQLTPSGAVLQRGRIDDPSGAKFFAFPSISVNSTNDALIGYSRFGADQYASGNYAYRQCGDPPGTTHDDTVLKAGEGPYTKKFSGAENRWGDFSATVVDPVNDAAMWTIQEYAALPDGSGADSGRWGTWWGGVATPSASERTLPGNPTLSSPSHPPNTWTSDATVDVAWSGASSGCGIDGYSFVFDTNPATLPDTVKDVEESASAVTSPLQAGPTVYFHLRAVDALGIWSDPVHAGPFLVDSAAPADPTPTSSSHTVGAPSTNRRVVVRWQGASDGGSGVDGFSYLWDTSQTTVPDTTKEDEETAGGATSPTLANGRWYFHLRTRDNVGNWTGAVHLGPFVIVARRVVRVVRCVVPNLRGKTLAQARRLLTARRCALGRVTRARSAKVRRGRVVSQSRRPGARLRRGTKVNVVVSRGRRR
jgi:hypothetical protein